MSLFGFGSGKGDRITVNFAGSDVRPTKRISGDASTGPAVPVFASGEPVKGMITIEVTPGKRMEHLGIKIELVGQIEMFYDRGNFHDFTSLVRELDAAGTLNESRNYPFDFSSVEKPYESYNGLNVRLRYFIRVTVTRHYTSGNMIKEEEFLVQKTDTAPEINNTIKMEVGIEECLHIEFEYDKQKYHLRDIIIGKVYFLLVRIKIKHMELAIIRREAAGTGPQQYNESETLTKFELMDGAPVRGECIPIRLFMSALDLTPTYRNINNKFSVKYYLNLVLVDQEDRRYFKQQEVVLWRKDIG